ncbi:MAG: amidohydrolase family protein [Kiritimatiellae bacterium]|nr:amidohydrolase family protein [Kiritimatiellia bacterium]
MSKKMIVDTHHHCGGAPDYIDRLAESYARVGIDKVCLISGRGVEGRGRVIEGMKKHPKLVVGIAGFDWENDKPDDIARFQGEGFSGVKFIRPPQTYHHKDFWPIYEKCRDTRLTGLFHLGIVSRGKGAGFLDNNFMRPIYLDCLARMFPEWNIHGAHLGNPWYEEATMSCRWNPNLYFDLSGSTLKKKKPEFLGELLWWNSTTRYRDPNGRDAWEKILFGSDVPHYEAHDVLHDYDNVIRALNLSDEIRWRILGGTAAEIYRIEEEGA